MLQHSTRLSGFLTATVASMSRATEWQLIDEVPLAFDAYHPQGMARVGSTWWISTVDVDAHRGFVLAVDRSGHLVEKVPAGDEQHYHPGGMDFDGEAFWIAAAEYRPNSTAVIQRFVPGGPVESIFEVDDHVGAIARCGRDGDLVGWSWGSRRFYRWAVDGTLLLSRTNPAHFIDHQDCQWLDTGHLLCGGVGEVALADGPGWLGGIGLLDTETLVLDREVPFPHYSPGTGRVGTHNPIWAETDRDRLIVHLLPDDGFGVIRSYATPLLSCAR